MHQFLSFVCLYVHLSVNSSFPYNWCCTTPYHTTHSSLSFSLSTTASHLLYFILILRASLHFSLFLWQLSLLHRFHIPILLPAIQSVTFQCVRLTIQAPYNILINSSFDLNKRFFASVPLPLPPDNKVKVKRTPPSRIAHLCNQIRDILLNSLPHEQYSWWRHDTVLTVQTHLLHYRKCWASDCTVKMHHTVGLPHVWGGVLYCVGNRTSRKDMRMRDFSCLKYINKSNLFNFF